MNSLSLNGSSINGVIRGLVYATVAFVCATTVDAAPIRVAKASSDITAVATVSSNATYTHSTGQVDFLGAGNVYLTPQHHHASKADLGGAVQTVAYVLRVIPVTATLNTGVNISAVVASYLGTANFTAGVTLAADAARIQKALVSYDGVAGVVLTLEPTVIRLHEANVQCGVLVRCEPSFAVSGGVTQRDAYLNIVTTGNVLASPLAWRMAAANLVVNANSTGLATLVQPGFAQTVADGMVVVAEPYVKATLISYVAVSASVNAHTILVKQGQADSTGSVNTTAAAVQEHQAYSVLQGTTTLTGATQLTQNGFASMVGSTQTTTQAIRILIGKVENVGSSVVVVRGNTNSLAFSSVPAACEISSEPEELNVRNITTTTECFGDVSVLATGTLTKKAYAFFFGSVSGDVLPDFYPRDGFANSESQVVVEVNPFLLTLIKQASANVQAQCSINAVAVIKLTGFTDIVTNALVYADTVCNPESLDPPERTYIRTAEDTEFSRQQDVTEFRRYA